MHRNGMNNTCEIYALDAKGMIHKSMALKNVIAPTGVTYFADVRLPMVYMDNHKAFVASLLNALGRVDLYAFGGHLGWIALRYGFDIISYDLVCTKYGDDSPLEAIEEVAAQVYAAMCHEKFMVMPPAFHANVCEMYAVDVEGAIVRRVALKGVIKPVNVTDFTRGHPIVRMRNYNAFMKSVIDATERVDLSKFAGPMRRVALRYGFHMISYDLLHDVRHDKSAPDAVKDHAMRVHRGMLNAGAPVHEPAFDAFWEIVQQAHVDHVDRRAAAATRKLA